jgi:hypothetical protein
MGRCLWRIQRLVTVHHAVGAALGDGDEVTVTAVASTPEPWRRHHHRVHCDHVVVKRSTHREAHSDPTRPFGFAKGSDPYVVPNSPSSFVGSHATVSSRACLCKA